MITFLSLMDCLRIAKFSISVDFEHWKFVSNLKGLKGSEEDKVIDFTGHSFLYGTYFADPPPVAASQSRISRTSSSFVLQIVVVFSSRTGTDATQGTLSSHYFVLPPVVISYIAGQKRSRS